MSKEEITLGKLCETLCNAQYIADELKSPYADQIMKIRQNVESEYLKRQKMESMSFGDAIEALKQGKMVARKGWNGKNMFIFLQCGYVTGSDNLPKNVEKWLDKNTEHDLPQLNVEVNSYLCIKAADGTIVNGWNPTQMDILSEDWAVVE